MKILYYDCFAGISGDMNLGALIDLGVEVEYLKTELGKLPVHGYELKVYRESRKGISGTRAEVTLKDHKEHGEGGKKHHHHNTYAEIRKMILSSQLEQRVKELSLDIFKILAEAESKVHHIEMDRVHFHEVGAVDSIVDIVGAAVCICKLKPDAIYASSVELGGGFVECAHGTYPVPAPATTEVVRNMPVKLGTVNHEATTPTGAAILATLVNEFTDKKEFRILNTGYGIGGRDEAIPNVLRVYWGDVEGKTMESDVVPASLIECNVDDMSPECYDHVIEMLFMAGAKDVFLTPIIMKKSRPAVKISVICDPDDADNLNEILLQHTTTIGTRQYPVTKTMLQRKEDRVTTCYGTIRVKQAFFKGKCIKSKPEYEDCHRIAMETNISIIQVYREAERILGNTDKNAGC